MAGSVKKCSFCGENYHRNPKLSATQWENRKFCSKKCSASTHHLSEKEIISLFDSGLLCTEIAEKLSVTPRVIKQRLKNIGVSRTRSEALKISHNREHVRKRLSISHLGQKCPEHVKEILRGINGPSHPLWRGGVTTSGGYPYFTASAHNGENAAKSVHTVLAERHLGYVRGNGLHVHHIDGNKSNNSLDNLTIMTASEHTRLHALERGFGRK